MPEAAQTTTGSAGAAGAGTGAASGVAGAGAGGGGGNNAAAAANGAAAGDAGAQFYRPQGLPDHLFGGNDGDKGTIDKVWGAYQGARRELSERGQVPADLSAYSFEVSEKAKPLIKIGDDDKVVPVLKELAQKHKLTDKQFGPFMTDFFDRIIDLGVIEAPIDPDKLFVDLAPEGFKGTDVEKKVEGGKRLQLAQNWIKGLGRDHGFDDGMKQELALLTTTPAGVKILETMMKGGMQASVSAGGNGAAAGAVTAQSLQARQADPRNDRNAPTFDESFRAETDRLYKQFYGD